MIFTFHFRFLIVLIFYFHEQLTNLFFNKYVDGCLFLFSQRTKKLFRRMEHAAGFIMEYFLKLLQ